MESQPSFSSRRRGEPDCSLRDCALGAQIFRENTRSRRFSGSHIRSFREDTRSFRSNITISSTASSPGYPFTEEIDPSTYSFTTALKALQARLGYNSCNSWECLSPDGFALNSKWNDAEKYICNPLSGEVPRECLSAKTLSGRSFRHLANKITMSASHVYSNPNPRHIYAKPCVVPTREDDAAHSPIKDDAAKMEGTTRDVGTQSTPTHELSPRSPSPTISTPSIVEWSSKRCETEGEDSSSDKTKLKAQSKVDVLQVEEKERGRKEEEARRRDCHDKEDSSERDREQAWKCSSRRRLQANGCLFWMRKRQREKQLPRKRNTFFLVSLEGC